MSTTLFKMSTVYFFPNIESHWKAKMVTFILRRWHIWMQGLAERHEDDKADKTLVFGAVAAPWTHTML